MKNLSIRTINRLRTGALMVMWAQMISVLVYCVLNSKVIIQLITQNR